jgi:hypothetical protein
MSTAKPAVAGGQHPLDQVLPGTANMLGHDRGCRFFVLGTDAFDDLPMLPADLQDA